MYLMKYSLHSFGDAALRPVKFVNHSIWLFWFDFAKLGWKCIPHSKMYEREQQGVSLFTAIILLADTKYEANLLQTSCEIRTSA